MNREINRLMALPGTKAGFAEVSADATPMSLAEVTALVQAENAVFGPVIKASGIKQDLEAFPSLF